MSGCFTQRGEFAAVNKFARAEMAVRNGADLVLELPTPWAVSGAERFARGGVELLKKTGLVTHLAFGSECGDLEALQRVEACLSAESFQETLRRRLEGGETFARCRQAAVVPAEPAAMEVRQHHQPSAVPARGQTGGGKCVFLDGEGVVPPPEPGSGQGQGRQQQRQGLLSAFFLVGHGGTSFPAVTYYIIGSPGFASPLLCIIAKNDERFL